MFRKIPFTLADFQRTGLAETRDGRQARFVSHNPIASQGLRLKVSMCDTDCVLHLFSNGAMWLYRQDNADLLYVLTPKEQDMKPELKDAYRKIVETFLSRADKSDRPRFVAEDIALACQALADRPRVELTDEDFQRIWDAEKPFLQWGFVRAVLAAHDNRPYVSEEVEFDYKAWSSTNLWDAIAQPSGNVHERLMPGILYTMRRKG